MEKRAVISERDTPPTCAASAEKMAAAPTPADKLAELDADTRKALADAAAKAVRS